MNPGHILTSIKHNLREMLTEKLKVRKAEVHFSRVFWARHCHLSLLQIAISYHSQHHTCPDLKEQHPADCERHRPHSVQRQLCIA